MSTTFLVLGLVAAAVAGDVVSFDFTLDNECPTSAGVYAPDGRPLNEPLPENQEGLVIADIDLGYTAMAKIAADPVGHYSRPDVLRLWLNAAPPPCVERASPLFSEETPGG